MSPLLLLHLKTCLSNLSVDENKIKNQKQVFLLASVRKHLI